MSQVSERSASDVSVAETLDLLDEQFPGLVDAVADGTYAFWLGSGISRECVEDVPALVTRILLYLQRSIDPTNAHCKFRNAFEEALELAALSEIEQEHTDLSRDVTEWATFSAITKRLSAQYAQLLDITIPGERPDFLLWTVVDASATYGDASIRPGTEHYCLAVLIVEGMLPDIVSANWDGLVEKAVADLVGEQQSILAVRVRGDDFREPNARSRILKFHGCAVRAKKDESAHRALLVGRRSQITQWPHDADHAVMRQEMSNLAATRRTLMMGLSAQDPNIQDLFVSAEGLLAWPWPSSPAAFVFAEEAIGSHQRNILRVSYPSNYNGHEAEIEQSAHLRAFAKPLLAALVLGALVAKLETLARLSIVESQYSALASEIREGLASVRALAATSVDESPDRVLGVIAEVGRALSLFREGTAPDTSLSYTPIGSVSANQITDDPVLRHGGTPRLALAISLFGLGHARSTWTLTADAERGVFRAAFLVESGGHKSRVFFAANGEAALQLELNGFVSDEDASVVVVHSARRAPAKQRSPRSAPGRTGRRTARHIDMAEVVGSASNPSDLMQRFREEITL